MPKLTKNIALTIDTNLEAIVIKNNNSRIIPFNMVGNGIRSNQMKEDDREAIDAIEEIALFTKPEMFLFLCIKRNMTWDMESTSAKIPSNLTSTEKQYIKKGYTLLNAKNLVRRVKRNVYMINPFMLIPKDEQIEIGLWDSLVKDCKKPTEDIKPIDPTPSMDEENKEVRDTISSEEEALKQMEEENMRARIEYEDGIEL